jgi:hypothetical protein
MQNRGLETVGILMEWCFDSSWENHRNPKGFLAIMKLFYFQ